MLAHRRRPARLLRRRLGRVLGPRGAEPEPEPKPRKPKREKPARERPKAPTPIELLEREIARTEERIADLERQLADDWTNVDLVNAHRAARDDLGGAARRAGRRLFEEAGT